MNIKLNKIKIKDLVNGYINNDEIGVEGFGGKLNIRPSYQREFVYDDKKRAAVIGTINKQFPLNVMYWAVNDDGSYEVLDGQQRTISICEYVDGNYSIDKKQFNNLTQAEKDEILNYELFIYFCQGNDKDKLDWFETINIAGLKLSTQELRNAVYSGPWLADAKRYFSKTKCSAHLLGNKYLKGKVNRQEYLETAIKWISNGDIEEYMSSHQHAKNATELWLYFQAVISWTEALFSNYRKEMKNVPWGLLYNNYKNADVSSIDLENEITILMRDEDVTKKSGIYDYILTRDERKLNIRGFSDNQRREAYEKQNGVCAVCNKKFDLKDMHADHINPWSNKGKTEASNCEMLCAKDNQEKGKKGGFVEGKELTITERVTESIKEFADLEAGYFQEMNKLVVAIDHMDIVYKLKAKLRDTKDIVERKYLGNLANVSKQVEIAKHATSHRWEGDEQTKLAAILSGNIAMKQLKK